MKPEPLGVSPGHVPPPPASQRARFSTQSRDGGRSDPVSAGAPRVQEKLHAAARAPPVCRAAPSADPFREVLHFGTADEASLRLFAPRPSGSEAKRLCEILCPMTEETWI